MSLKQRLSQAKTRRQQQKRESEAFKEIVRKRTLAERRRAFEREALKVAAEEGASAARKKKIRQILAERLGGAIRAKAAGAPRRVPVRQAPVRRTVRRAPVRRVARRAPVMRTAPKPTYSGYSAGDMFS